MVSSAKTVAEFLATLPAVERAVFAQLRAEFRKAGAALGESMKYRMPTYLIGENIVGGFNKQKHYLCLYLNPEAVDPHRAELKQLGLDCGKSCIRFRQPDQLPLPLAAKMIAKAIKLAK